MMVIPGKQFDLVNTFERGSKVNILRTSGKIKNREKLKFFHINSFVIL